MGRTSQYRPRKGLDGPDLPISPWLNFVYNQITWVGERVNNLALSLLGIPVVERNGHPVNMERHKGIALLAYLAVTGTTHRRDELAAFLWPELDQTRARGALRRTLSTLTIALAGDWLQTDRETIGLPSSARFSLDVTLFHDLLGQC